MQFYNQNDTTDTLILYAKTNKQKAWKRNNFTTSVDIVNLNSIKQTEESRCKESDTPKLKGFLCYMEQRCCILLLEEVTYFIAPFQAALFNEPND